MRHQLPSLHALALCQHTSKYTKSKCRQSGFLLSDIIITTTVNSLVVFKTKMKYFTCNIKLIPIYISILLQYFDTKTR